VRANGEDFVREGFTTKDGWTVDFDHVYVSFADINAYQVEPAFDPAAAGEMPKPKVAIAIPGPTVVDLTAIKNGEKTVLVGDVTAPAGQYNALTWQMPPATTGPAQGYSLLIVGTASKTGKTLPFSLGVQEPFGFACGDFVGDERKGILAAGGAADVEATFHFDHLFGDGEELADSEINFKALGFDPLAAMAQNNTVNLTSNDLKAVLTEAQYQSLLQILAGLGHTGEEHCRALT
jgi:hypothetical protein